MDINYILENKELKTLLDNSVGKTYYKYHLDFIIEYDDFYQEVIIYVMKRIKNFDSEKSSLKTYIPLIVMSCAKNCIVLRNGQCKGNNKLEFENSFLSIDASYSVNDDSKDINLINALTSNYTVNENKLIVDEILNMSNLTAYERRIIELLAEGYSLTDIAHILNKNVANVHTTFQRTKQKIVRKYVI